MEPDILASAGEPRTTTAQWLDPDAIQTEESTQVETSSDSPNPRGARLHHRPDHSAESVAHQLPHLGAALVFG